MVQPPAPANMDGKKDASWQETDLRIAETMKEVAWCCTTPLCCGGCGWSECFPCFAADCKVCCIQCHGFTQPFNLGTGWCFQFTKAFCCVTHCACGGDRKQDGAPVFACCNARGCNDFDENVATTPRAQIMKDAFLLFYCLCGGCGVGRCTDPCAMGSAKACCLRSEVFTADVWSKDKPICFNYTKCCWCITAHAIPCFGGRKDGVPGCNCCMTTFFWPPAEPGQQ